MLKANQISLGGCEVLDAFSYLKLTIALISVRRLVIDVNI
jgi:hypothetical protein